jgi:hypothetical protein
MLVCGLPIGDQLKVMSLKQEYISSDSRTHNIKIYHQFSLLSYVLISLRTIRPDAWSWRMRVKT